MVPSLAAAVYLLLQQTFCASASASFLADWRANNTSLLCTHCETRNRSGLSPFCSMDCKEDAVGVDAPPPLPLQWDPSAVPQERFELSIAPAMSAEAPRRFSVRIGSPWTDFQDAVATAFGKDPAAVRVKLLNGSSGEEMVPKTRHALNNVMDRSFCEALQENEGNLLVVFEDVNSLLPPGWKENTIDDPGYMFSPDECEEKVCYVHENPRAQPRRVLMERPSVRAYCSHCGYRFKSGNSAYCSPECLAAADRGN